MKSWHSILLILLCAIGAHATVDIPLNLTLPDKPITLGEPVNLILDVTYPTNGLLTVPSLDRKKEIVQLQLITEEPRRKGAQYEQRFIYRCTSFRLGSHPINGAPLQLQVGEELHQIAFPSGLLEVRSSLAENSEDRIEPMREPVHQNPILPRWAWLVIGTLLIAFLVGRWSRIVRQFFQKADTLPPTPLLPPHVIALRALQTLEHDLHFTPSEADAFFTELSLILRTYLQGRFQIDAPEQTREEIRIMLPQSLDLTPEQQASLNRFFDEAEQIKFARGNASDTAMQQALSHVRHFVEQTAQHEPLVEES